jgi:hypothetical protein
MSLNAREVIELLVISCEKLADAAPGNLEIARQRLPTDTSEYDRAFLDGYCAGHVKAYQGIAEDLRKVLRDNPSSTVKWPRISIGVGFFWPFSSGSN